MRMEQLHYLVEISKHKSMNLASQKIHISPQALSMAIKALESELGFPLLKRSHKGVSVTDAGKTLIQLTEHYWQSVAELVEANTTKKMTHLDLSGELDLCTTFGGGYFYLPKLIRHLYQICPQLKLNLIEQSSVEVINMVISQQFEFAFYDYFFVHGVPQKKLPEMVHFQLLDEYQFVSQIPTAYPISQYKSVSIKTLFKYPLILRAPTNNEDTSVATLLHVFGSPEKIYFENNASVTMELLMAGLGVKIILIPKHHPTDKYHCENVRIVPINDDINYYFGYITNRNNPQHLYNPLQDYIKEHFHVIFNN